MLIHCMWNDGKEHIFGVQHSEFKYYLCVNMDTFMALSLRKMLPYQKIGYGKENNNG